MHEIILKARRIRTKEDDPLERLRGGRPSGIDPNGTGSSTALQDLCDSPPSTTQPRHGAGGRPTVIKRSGLGKILHAFGLG